LTEVIAFIKKNQKNLLKFFKNRYTKQHEKENETTRTFQKIMAIISIFLSIILFLINGVSVLRFYQVKDYLLKRVLAQFYFLSSKKIIFSKKEYFLYFLIFLSLFFPKNIQILKPDLLIFLIFLLLVLRIDLLKKIHFTLKAILVSFLAFLINFSSFIYFSKQLNNFSPSFFMAFTIFHLYSFNSNF
jgi:hypothetical protein